jgi:PAS domain S-box-containing protein
MPIKVLGISPDLNGISLLQDVVDSDPGANISLVWVDTIEQGLDQLSQQECDLLLIDFEFLAPGPMAALEKVGKRAAGMAVVACSSRPGPDSDLQALRLGAQEFLELTPEGAAHAPRLIQRAMARHTSLWERRKSDLSLHTFLEQSRDGIVFFNKRGRITDWNPAQERITGIPREQMLGCTYWEMMDRLMVPEVRMGPDHEPLQSVSTEIFASGKHAGLESPLELELITPGKERKFVQVSSFPLPAQDGFGIASLTRDITRQKMAEQELRLSERHLHMFLSLFETMVQGVIFVNTEGRIFLANPAAERIFGIPLKEMAGQSLVSSLWKVIQADGSEFPKDQYPSTVALRTGQPVKNVVMGLNNPDREAPLWLDISSVPLFNPGEDAPFLVYTTFEDITGQKLAREDLQKSRASLELAQSLANLGSWEHDPQTDQFLQLSREVFHLLGLDPALPVPTVSALLERVHPDDRDLLIEAESLVLDCGEDVSLEFRFNSQPGGERYFKISMRSMRDARGKATISGTLLDFTEPRRAFEKLQESETKYRLLTETINDVVWIIDLQDSIIRYVSPSIQQLRGISAADVIGKPASEIFLSSAYEYYSRHITWRMAEFQRGFQKTYVDEIQQNRSDGTTTWLEAYTCIVRNLDSGRLEMYGVGRDITRRKQVEQALRRSEAQLAEAQRMGRLGYMEWNIENDALTCSNEYYRILGLPPGSVITKGTINQMLIPEDFRSLWSQDLQAIQDRSDLDYEFRIRRADGQVRWLHQIGKMSYDAQGTLVRMMAVILDITERKEAEVALRESQARMELALRGANAGTWEWNVQTGETVFNERWAEITGYTLPELQPVSIQTWVDLCHPDDLQVSNALLEQHFSGKIDKYECELRMRHKNGDWVWVIDRGRVMEWDASGRPLRMFGTHTDVTERKREERYTQARLRLAALSQETMDLDRLMSALLDEAEALTDSDMGFFHLVDDDQTTLILQAWSQKTLEYFCKMEGRGQHYPVDKAGAWADAVRSGEACIYNDYKGLAARREFPKGHPGLTRMISLPIRRGSKVLAILGVGNKNQDYEARDLDMLKRLSEEAFDIYLRKQAEAALRLSEEKYRSLMESLTSVVAIIDADGTFHYMNDLAARELGGTPGELIGKTMYDLFPYPVASQQMENIKRVLQEDRGLVNENISSVHGEPRWHRATLQPIHDQAGRATRALVNSVDIHDLKTMQQELQDLNATLEQRIRLETAKVQDLYENAPTGYHSLDQNGILVRINQTELSWLGYTRDEMIGRLLLDFITPASQEEFRHNFPVLKQQGYLKDIEFEFVRKDGTFLPVLMNSTASYDERGEFVMTRSTILDLTQRKLAEETQHLANLEMARALRLKDEFLANMSHELRTPLNAILGISELLQSGIPGSLNERQSHYMQNIDTSGHHLLTLINDLLDISKIESGKLEIHLESVSLSDVCQSSLSLVKELAIKKKIALQYQPGTTLSTILADPIRLKQILVNLLSNAVKFTPDGGKVTLEVAANPSKSRVEFSVSDTGIGIAAGDLLRLFTPFSQVDSSLTRKYEGTGLGLALVKKLTELHGGEVFVTSEPGRGSCFTISLPWQPAPEAQRLIAGDDDDDQAHDPPARAVAPPSASPWKILLVEDNEYNILSVEDYLEGSGYRVEVARNGKEALDKIDLLQPDLILMDIQMPVMDGLEATRRLRSNPAYAEVPIIALTALAMPGDRDSCLEAGASAYIQKPVRLKEMANLIEKLLHRAQPGDEPLAPNRLAPNRQDQPGVEEHSD